MQNKLFKLFFYLIVIFLSNYAFSSTFTAEGKKFFYDICAKDKFYENASEIVTRYQRFYKVGNEKLGDENLALRLVKEMIEKEEDNLFKYRIDRDKNTIDKQELLRYKFADASWDIVRLSALGVFMEYKIDVDEIRIKRRLNESCNLLVLKHIN
jgi:hypothetical protein